MASSRPILVKPKINPLSRIPKSPRLVMAVRGGAGVGKSHFAKSMFEAEIGRLCIFDTERKSRLLKGVGADFDALEIETPDELPQFIEWALHGEGREQNYQCFALDSWAAYFGAKHSETIMAVRERTGDPLAQPSAEELANDQMVLQGVLRKLCMESGKSVVIVDQIAARGKEAKEDNEVGRVLPMTASGLEYFVDIMVEVSLQERDGEITRVFQIVKSNSPAFEVGFELTGDVTFADFLNQLKNENSPKPTRHIGVSPVLALPPEAPEDDEPSVHNLLETAETLGFKHGDVVTAARIYHNQTNIYKLSQDQIEDLEKRMRLRAEGRSNPRVRSISKAVGKVPS